MASSSLKAVIMLSSNCLCSSICCSCVAGFSFWPVLLEAAYKDYITIKQSTRVLLTDATSSSSFSIVSPVTSLSITPMPSLYNVWRKTRLMNSSPIDCIPIIRILSMYRRSVSLSVSRYMSLMSLSSLFFSSMHDRGFLHSTMN